MLRPDPITDVEVIGWFVESMPKGPIPSAEHLTPFIALVRSHHQFNLRTQLHFQVQRERESKLPSPGLVGEALDHAYALRSALDELSVFGHGFWMGMGVSPHRVANLRTALGELGPYLRPRPQKTRGRKPMDWHHYADLYATAIAAALRTAGFGNPSEDQVGPVARIGVKAIRRVLPDVVIAGPASFASGVRAERRRKGRAPNNSVELLGDTQQFD